jgi:hypothetical protein
MNNEEIKEATVDANNTTTTAQEQQQEPQVPVIETTSLPTPPSPVTVKVIEQKADEDGKKNKKPDKDPDDLEAAKKPSPLRQLLPIGLFLVTFATVLSLLIIYLDTSGKSLLFYL